MNVDLHTIRAVALDLDGVVWRGEERLPGVPQFFTFLNQRGIPYVFLTNNSTRTPAEYVPKIGRYAIPVHDHQVINSGIVTAEAMVKNYPSGTPIYVVGSESLAVMLRARGYLIDPDNAQVVVVGLDTQMTYEKLTIAGRRILAGAAFIGTNADATFPVPGGLTPGAGSLIAAVQTMTGHKPLIMGKPQPTMFEIALERLGAPPERTLMIGDRLDTDILGAAGVSMKTALVLTGISHREDIPRAQAHPDLVTENLETLMTQWAL